MATRFFFTALVLALVLPLTAQAQDGPPTAGISHWKCNFGYIGDLVWLGDMGPSFKQKDRSVNEIIGNHIGTSAVLGGAAMTTLPSALIPSSPPTISTRSKTTALSASPAKRATRTTSPTCTRC